MLIRQNFKKLGKFLRTARIKANLSQGEVAKNLRYSTAQFISNIERGLCAPPVDAVRKLIEIYRLNPHRLIKNLTKEYRNNLVKILIRPPKK
jgi:transcriptional regulator with XRE-family HTH domain